MSLKTRNIIVDTVADLANIQPGDGDLIEVLGYTSAGDGGGQIVRYDADSVTAVDGGLVFYGPSLVGRYIAIEQAEINVKRFGAVGDGSTNDSSAIQSALNALSSGSTLVFPKATYLCYALNIDQTDGWQIDLQGSTLKVPDSTAVSSGNWLIRVRRCDDWSIKNGVLDGNRDNRTPAEVSAHTLMVRGGSRYVVENVRSINAVVDGFYITSEDTKDYSSYTSEGQFINCVADNCYRQGMSIISGRALVVQGGAYINTSGTAPQAGIDIEANSTDTVFTANSGDDTLNASGHGFADDTPVMLTSTGTLPAELTSELQYYVVNADANSFQVSLTAGGSAVAFTDNGSGTHTVAVSPQIDGVLVTGARFEGNAGYGVAVVNEGYPSAISIQDNVFKDCAEGAIYAGGRCTIHANDIRDFSESARGIIDVPVTTLDSVDILISENKFANCTSAFPLVYAGQERVKFINNQAKNCYQLIHVWEPYALISGNTCEDMIAGTAIINIRDNYCHVVDNTIIRGKHNAIYVDTAGPTRVVGNKIIDNDSSGSLAYGAIRLVSGRTICTDNVLYKSTPNTSARGIRIQTSRGEVARNHIEGWSVTEALYYPGSEDEFSDGDATPSVALRGILWKTANTSSTTITDFDDGVEGQILEVSVTDTNTTIANNSNIVTLSGRDITIVGVLTFEYREGVWRQVAGNNTDVYRVVDFGSVPSDSASNRIALQAAIDTASAAGGGTVLLPEGTLELNDEIYLRSGVHLKGAGQSQTILQRGQGGNWAEEDAIIWIITYTDRSDSTYVADIENVRVSDMTIDFNFASWQDYTPAITIDGRGLVTGDSDAIRNVEIDHITFIDSQNTVPDSANDAWCIAANARALVCENLRVHDCKSPEHHQFITGGNGTGWDGIWYYNNYIYHPRDNGLTVVTTYDDVDDGAGTLGTVTHNQNVHIYDNVVVGPSNYGIWCGVDGSARARGARMSNVNIHNNTIIQDAYVDPVSSTSQIGIGITICEAGISKLSITNNTVRHDDPDSSVDHSILVKPASIIAESGIDTDFVQPDVGESVLVSFAVDPDYRVGSTFIVGDSSTQGGLYEVIAISGSGDYGVERLRFPVGVDISGTVPSGSDSFGKGVLRDAIISGNICDNAIEVRNVSNSRISNNICKAAGSLTNRCFHLESSDNVIVSNNTFHDQPAWIYYSNRASLLDNTFDQEAISAGWIQMKANDDGEGRTSKIITYVSNNHGVAGVTPNKVIAQTGAGSHEMAGDFLHTGSPESSIAADIGSVCYRVNGGSNTTLYIKESGTGNTGWTAK